MNVPAGLDRKCCSRNEETSAVSGAGVALGHIDVYILDLAGQATPVHVSAGLQVVLDDVALGVPGAFATVTKRYSLKLTV